MMWDVETTETFATDKTRFSVELIRHIMANSSAFLHSI